MVSHQAVSRISLQHAFMLVRGRRHAWHHVVHLRLYTRKSASSWLHEKMLRHGCCAALWRALIAMGALAWGSVAPVLDHRASGPSIPALKKVAPHSQSSLWLLQTDSVYVVPAFWRVSSKEAGLPQNQMWHRLTLSCLGLSARSSFGNPSPLEVLSARTAGVITLSSHAGLVVPALHGKSMSALKIRCIHKVSEVLPKYQEPSQVHSVLLTGHTTAYLR